jgi:predicted phosphodiesterase
VAAACAIEPYLSRPSLIGARDINTFIVSDLHLGLPASRPRDLLTVLQQWRFERLILLGDIFHDWSFRHLRADAWHLLAHIRNLSQRREAEVVWVLGNHDRHLGSLVAKLVGVETTETFRWQYGGRSFMALHGDRFDRFISSHVRTSAFFSRAYAFTQRWLSKNGEWPKRLDRAHIGFGSLSRQVEAVHAAMPANRRSTSSSVGTPTAPSAPCSSSRDPAAKPSNTSTPAAGSTGRRAS